LIAAAPAAVPQSSSEVASAYKQGKYDAILKKIDDSFQQGDKQGLWNPIRQQASADQTKNAAITKQYNTDQGKKDFAEATAKEKQLEDQLEQLGTEKDTQLQKVISTYPQAPISKLIQAELAIPSLTTDQKQAYYDVEMWASPFSTDPTNPLIQQLKDIDLNYAIKQQLLQAAFQPGQNKSTQIPIPDLGTQDPDLLQTYNLALQLDKFNAMRQAALKAGQQQIADKLASMIASYPSIAAKMQGGVAIQQALQNSTDDASKQVQTILQSFSDKKQALEAKFQVGGS
jgi:hypothetical protein